MSLDRAQTMPASWLRFFIILCILTILLIASLPAYATTPGGSLQIVPGIYSLAEISHPYNVLQRTGGMTVDPTDNLYISDTDACTVYRVDVNGRASKFAGGNGCGPVGTGNGGLATAAVLAYPNAIASDSLGNIFVADGAGVRRIDALSGVITTMSPISASGLAADLFGYVYFSDYSSNVVRRIDPFGNITVYAGGGNGSSYGNNGPATSASLSQPGALAVDSNNNLFIADAGYKMIRRVDFVTKVITTYAGTGSATASGNGGPATSAGLGYVGSLAFDSDGSLLFTSGITQLRKIDASGTINVFAGRASNSSASGNPPDGTPAIDAVFNTPTGLAVNSVGDVFFGDQALGSVFRVVQHPERFPNTRSGQTSYPRWIVLKNTGNTSVTMNSVQVSGDYSAPLDPTGHYYVPFSTDAQICTLAPLATATLSPGNFCQLGIVLKPTADGTRVGTFTLTSTDTPSTMTLNLASGYQTAQLAATNGEMLTVGGNYWGATGVRGEGGPAIEATIAGVTGMVTDSSGNIYFSEYGVGDIRRIDAQSGVITTVAGVPGVTGPSPDVTSPALGVPLGFPMGMTMNASGDLMIVDRQAYRVRRLLLSSSTIETYAGQGACAAMPACTGQSSCAGLGDGYDALNATKARLCSPVGIAIDAKSGNVYISDSGSHVIRMVDSNHVMHTVAGLWFTAGYSGDNGSPQNATFNNPGALALDSAGNLYVADNFNQVVRKINFATNTISTYAGHHYTGSFLKHFAGDGGLAQYWATLDLYTMGNSLAFDAKDNLYIVDEQNDVVRKVNPTNGIITSVAGTYTAYCESCPVGSPFLPDGYSATGTGLVDPTVVAVNPSGQLLIGSLTNSTIRVLSPDNSMWFGGQTTGTASATQSLTFTNIGPGKLTFDAQPYAITGDFASVPGGSCDSTSSLAVGASCTVLLSFTPTAVGGRLGAINFQHTGIGTPEATVLRGAGWMAQSIHLAPMPTPVLYGIQPMPISAFADSGLPVNLAEAGPGFISSGALNITEVGTVTVIATQDGGGMWAPAAPVTQTIEVNPQTVTVTADNKTIRYGQPVPQLTYQYGPLVNGDTTSVIFGTPILSVDLTGGLSPTGGFVKVGTYPIMIDVGPLSATNYGFVGYQGMLTVLPPLPPSIMTGFVSASIGLNSPTPLSFYIGNPNANVTLTGLAFSAQLGGGLQAVLPLQVTDTCGGMTSVSADQLTFTLSGGQVFKGKNCWVTVMVQPISQPGPVSATATVAATESGPGNVASASATVGLASQIVLSAPATAPAASIITLTATVSDLTGNPMTAGTVKFCTAANPNCEDTSLLGIAQLTPSGTASIKVRLGPGTYTLRAVFSGKLSLAGSSSAAQQLTVTGLLPTSTIMNSLGTPGSETMYGAVVGAGPAYPTGVVTLADTSFGNTTIATAHLTYGASTPAFQWPQVYSTGGSPYAVATGDFNGDGYPDLVAANSLDSTISILLGNGDGTLQPQLTITVGSGPTGVAVGDFNGDGKLDIAVTNTDSGTVSILIGNGDGTFQAQKTYPVGNGPNPVVVGDFNADGNLDLAIANQLDSAVVILLGNGDGTFLAPVSYTVGYYAMPTGNWSMAVADFNSDGNSDLVVTSREFNVDWDPWGNPNLTPLETVSVLLGNGNGTFQSQQVLTPGNAPSGVTVGDFNRDGNPDIAVVNLYDNQVGIYLGNGDGTFQPQQVYPTASGPSALLAADLQHNGILDLAVASRYDNVVTFLHGNGDGTFQAPSLALAGNAPFAMAAADFNGDGYPDLAVANFADNNITVLLDAWVVPVGVANVGLLGDGVNHLIQGNYSGDSLYAVSSSTKFSVAGAGALPTLSPGVIPFGNLAVSFTSPSASIQLSNNASVAIVLSGISSTTNFVVTGTTCGAALAANSSCAISVAFKPTTVGSFSETMNIVAGAIPLPVSLFGTGVPAAYLSVTSLDFSYEGVNVTSMPRQVTIYNYSGAAWVPQIPASTSVFATQAGNCTGLVANNKFCTFTVTYKPTSLGGTIAALKIQAGSATLPLQLSGTGVGSVYLNYPVVSFGTEGTGDTSAPKVVALYNFTGNPLTPQIPASTAPFTLSPGSCSAPVAHNASCSFSITFSPTALGAATANLLVQAGSTTLPLTLVGSGVQPAYLSTGTINFGNEGMGDTSAAWTVVLYNYTGAALTPQLPASASPFAVIPGNCAAPVANNANCSFTVTFTPTALGASAAVLNVQAGSVTLPLSVTGAGVQPLYLTTSSIGFGNEGVGDSSPGWTVVLYNYTGAALTPQLPSVAPFAISPGNCAGPVANNASCSFTVSFTPTALGAAAAVLNVQANAVTLPISVTGTGVQPLYLNTSTISFGNEGLGDSSPAWTVVLYNYTGLAIAPQLPLSTGSFTVSSGTCTGTLANNASCSFTVTFAPTALGAAAAALNVQANGVTLPLSVSGVGVQPLYLNTSSISFGKEGLGDSSAAWTVVLYNYTGVALTPQLPVSVAPFAVLPGTCTGTVANNASCSFTVTFAPAALGSAAANLNVLANGVTLPLAVTGTGVPPLYLNTSTINFGNAGIGNPLPGWTVALYNYTGAAFTPQLPASVAPFTVSPGNCAALVANNASCSFTVTFAPTALGSAAAALNVQANGVTLPLNVTGTGVPPVYLSSSSLAFGNEGVGDTSPAKVVVLFNYTGAAFTPVLPSSTGGFTILPYTCVGPLANNANCSFTINFSPSAMGAASVALNVQANSTALPISFTGTGVSPLYLGNTSLAFGNQMASTVSAPRTVTLYNYTGVPIVPQIPASVGAYTTSPGTCASPVVNNASCNFTVNFAPLATGQAPAILTILGGTATQQLTLSGNGILPLYLSVSSIDFGNQGVNTSSALKTITFYNYSGVPQTPQISSATPFKNWAGTCALTVANNSSCTFSVAFAPNAAGYVTSNLKVQAASTSMSVALTGTGN